MNAAAIIERVRASGGEIALAVDGIKLKTPASLREELVGEVNAQKRAIRLALKAEAGGLWDADDYRAFYDETEARLIQLEGLSKQKAEAFAFECAVMEWLNRTFKPSLSRCCIACGRGAQGCDPTRPEGPTPAINGTPTITAPSITSRRRLRNLMAACRLRKPKLSQTEWLYRNFVRSRPGCCVARDGGERDDDALLPRKRDVTAAFFSLDRWRIRRRRGLAWRGRCSTAGGG
jgi:hypothetical protein